MPSQSAFRLSSTILNLFVESQTPRAGSKHRINLALTRVENKMQHPRLLPSTECVVSVPVSGPSIERKQKPFGELPETPVRKKIDRKCLGARTGAVIARW